MGVDCPNVWHFVHFRPPSDTDLMFKKLRVQDMMGVLHLLLYCANLIKGEKLINSSKNIILSIDEMYFLETLIIMCMLT